MRLLMGTLILISFLPLSVALAQTEAEPTEEQLRQQCERDLNCARKNSETDTEFVSNAADPELCKGACARHVHTAYPNDALTRPAAIRPVSEGSSSGSAPQDATQ